MVDTRRRAAKTAARGGMLRAVIADDLAAVRGKVAKGSSMWWCPEGGLTALHLAVVFASPQCWRRCWRQTCCATARFAPAWWMLG